MPSKKKIIEIRSFWVIKMGVEQVSDECSKKLKWKIEYDRHITIYDTNERIKEYFCALAMIIHR